MASDFQLNDDERARLEEIAKSPHSPPSLAQRSKIILASALSNASAIDIAQQHGVSPATVRRWRRQFSILGSEGLADAQRSGARRQISDAMRARIAELHAAGRDTRRIARNIGVSQSSVSRILRQMKPAVGANTEAPAPDISALIRELFESLADTTPLARFLKSLQNKTNSFYCGLLVFSNKSMKPSFILADGQPLEGELPYIEKYYKKELLLSLPEGKVITSSDLFSYDEFHGSELYQEYLKEYGVGHILGMDIGTVRGVAGNFRLARLESDEDFGARERALCEALIPYLRAALNILVMRLDMEAEKEALSATVSGMSVGSILVDPDGVVLEANPPALAILDQHDGLILTNNRLVLDEPAKSRLLHDLIRKNAERKNNFSASGSARAMMVERPSGRESISLIVRPGSGAKQLAIRQTALIHLVDPARPRTSVIDALIHLYGLTPAEAKVALFLSNGNSIAETARASTTSQNTTRSHIRSIFSKMGINRQSELIRTVLISVAMLPMQTQP
ncbi:helix-turn-helix domain-containing protein [Sphingomonas sp. C3-2]|uniref:helix-turn-helix domain-containing protein n=1 Tax=Sphingomonas sp. C3-2 TaxID=3062169 RepID=UPI00294AB302|nr:helix-turn-helix domain-containing protein [Sphingomonas sp. C3-2]WOK37283.1 helix-turn-helix domain-containing protein [Sphingomonas sp. C3-2]